MVCWRPFPLLQTGDLLALNVLLNCIDTLSAHAAELNSNLGGRVARLTLRERRHVERLPVKHGIEIP